MNKTEHVIIELTVNNHPGVMYNITGLFARRAFNLEGILCGRTENTNTSKMYLLIKNDNRIDQTIKQLEKLYDVIAVSICDNCDFSVFDNISKLIELK